MRGVQLLDVLLEWNVDPARGGELVEGRIQRRGLGREQEGLAGELRERAGIGGHRAHAVRRSRARAVQPVPAHGSRTVSPARPKALSSASSWLSAGEGK